MTLDQIGPFVFAGLFVNSAIGLNVMRLIIERLRLEHRQTWDRLGSPVFLSNDAQSGIALFNFLMKREYEGLRDARLDKLATTAKKTFFVQIIGMVMVAAWLLS